MTQSLSGADRIPTDTRIAQARLLYEQGDMSVRKIAQSCGLTMTTLYHAARRDGWAMRGVAIKTGGEPFGPIKLSLVPAGQDPLELARRRRALVGRAWALAEAQMNDLERRMRRLKSGGAPAIQGEREARTMASLVRALKALAALDGPGGTRKLHGADQDRGDFPRDVTELKNQLARHLEGLRRERAGETAAGDAPK